MNIMDDRVIKKEQVVPGKRSPEWNGYSIDELEQRRVINSVKCDLIKEQLTLAFKGMTGAYSASGTERFNVKLDQLMTWGAYGLQFFGYARRFMSIYRNFKSAFSSSGAMSK